MENFVTQPNPTRGWIRPASNSGPVCRLLKTVSRDATYQQRCYTPGSESSASRLTSLRNVPPAYDQTATACLPITTNIKHTHTHTHIQTTDLRRTFPGLAGLTGGPAKVSNESFAGCWSDIFTGRFQCPY